MTNEIEDRVSLFTDQFTRVREEIGKVIVGAEEIIDGTLIGLLAKGHVLLEGIPGIGKTKIVATVADVLHLNFSRIQFTPDLMPGDVVGSNVVHETAEGAKVLKFEKGPIHTNILLADEINRATPKTQSALLEAMQEQTVTVGTTTHKLDPPFFVLATQNPIELEGTYPLPEAQMDRFFYKLRIMYPEPDHMHEIMDRTTKREEPIAETVLGRDEILAMRDTARDIPIARPVQDYAIRLTLATHPDTSHAHPMSKQYVRYGASPRGTQTLVVGGKVNALLNGRLHVSCEDIRSMLLPALRHRMMLNFEGEAERIDTDEILRAIMKDTPEPAE
ncbi:MAG TPA: MoxR family ATPase [Acidobacteriota bacterium]|jgi:MoxR-like ATPase|nr:MoxR family ATPase [Acidobacteriota bacterium]HJO29280.1 MoxR family ATPase [Acidobacteriota bacterium]|tara:strand:- start:1061 stop:2056 length:996 start_codon:yes stop_codon:yes gene_type:complete